MRHAADRQGLVAWLKALWTPSPPPSIWYHPAYRLPLAGLPVPVELRRADFVLWTLLEMRGVPRSSVRIPTRASFYDLARVHTDELLASLNDPERLASIFALHRSEIVPDELLDVVRLATGATVAAARDSLASRQPSLNLLGGFHHAGPGTAGGFCAVNDIAVAVGVLRAEGFDGQVVVLDLDAHPPDGTAACLRDDPRAWIGSLSAVSWGDLGAVDETVLAEGCGDDAYDAALAGLLGRMPRPDLAFVIAGGDVLAGDRLGLLGLSLVGARRRDQRVAGALEGIGSVWLPGGGYHFDSWRLLAGTALVLAGRPRATIPAGLDPLRSRFARIGERTWGVPPPDESSEITEEDLQGGFGPTAPRGPALLLGRFTAHAVEHALYRFGLLAQLRRLGYADIRVALDQKALGDRIRVYGRADGMEHLVAECVLERKQILGEALLYVHWLTLRNPRVCFSPGRSALPGQDAPGLGLAREADEMLLQFAERVGLAGVAIRPAHYHVARVVAERYRFVDPAQQGRFEALVRDVADHPIGDVTRAVEEGRVLLNDVPYRWEPDLMVRRVTPRPEDRGRVEQARDGSRFTISRGDEPPG